MNLKIQDNDRTFIVAAYKRDPYAFNAHAEAAKYGVSLRTIYNVLSKAGIRMKRGRKPMIAPSLISASDAPETPISMPPVLPSIRPSKPEMSPPRKGPPVIRPELDTPW